VLAASSLRQLVESRPRHQKRTLLGTARRPKCDSFDSKIAPQFYD